MEVENENRVSNMRPSHSFAEIGLSDERYFTPSTILSPDKMLR